MIKYNDIPDSIKQSQAVLIINKKAPRWGARTLIAEYMDAYTHGVLANIKTPNAEGTDKRIQLENICIYYILKKNLLKKMSPLVSARSSKYLMTDNKQLLDSFDMCIKKGIDSDIKAAQSVLMEISNRFDGE